VVKDGDGQEVESVGATRSFRWSYVLVALVFTAVVLYAARGGVRGTDQYWYVDEVDALAHGTAFTYAYPVGLLTTGRLPQQFVHHTLNHHVILPAVALFGAFGGWIAMGIAASLIVAILIAAVVRMLAGPIAALCAFTIFLFLPITIWQSSQPLVEATMVPYIAAALFIYVRGRDDTRQWVLLFVLALALFYCRTSFVPLLLIPPAAIFLSRHGKPTLRSLALPTLLLAVAAVAFAARGDLLPEQGGRSVARMLNNAVPGVTDNMHGMFTLGDEPIEAWKLWRKATTNLRRQLIPDRLFEQLFFLPVNLLAAVALTAFWRGRKREMRIAWFLIAFLAVHVMTIVLHQNQFRYTLLLVPAALAGAVVIVSRARPLPRTSWIAVGLVLVALTAVDFGIATYLGKDARVDARQMRDLRQAVEGVVPRDDTVVAIGLRDQLVAHALKPRNLLYLDPLGSGTTFRELVNMARGRWFICKPESPVLSEAETGPAIVIATSGALRDYRLYRVLDLKRAGTRNAAR
jgi:hypothetical protein